MKKVYLPNQCYFITSNVANRMWVFGKLQGKVYIPNNNLCRILIDVMKFTRDKFKFLIHGYVIMPDHFHIIVSTTGDKSPVNEKKPFV